MSELISMQDYQSDIQYIDKDHTASMFMTTCELNKVYSEDDYKIFVASECYGVDFKIIEDSIYDMWGDMSQYPPEAQGLIAGMIQEQIIESKRQKAKEIWEKVKNDKIMDISFRYPSSWTYNDVLLYFKKYGFPKYRYTETDKYKWEMNVYRVRHILRNDIMTDEAILLALVEMYRRKEEIKQKQEDNKVLAVVMIVVAVVVLVITTILTFGSADAPVGAALAAAIASLLASIGSIAVSIVQLALNEIHEEAMKEQNARTRDLMLKNMPKPGNFVDVSISDPYAMYANGRLYKQGGAGREHFDQMLPYEPYRYLDDNFKDSDMFDILNNKLDKFAGGDDYFPSLYRDAKWTSPKAMRTLLNGAIPIYLNMRSKILDAIFRWLTDYELGAYYLYEPNWDDSIWTSKDNFINRYGNVEFQDESSIYGFTYLAVVYNYHIEIKVYKKDPETGELIRDSETREPILDYTITKWAVSQFSTNTSWDKTEDNKTQKKENNITENSRIVFIKEESKILKGSEIKLELYSLLNNKDTGDGISYINFYENDYIIYGLNGFKPLLNNATKTPFAKQDSYYECTYRIYTYGKKEVIIYSAINELKNYKKDKQLEYENKLSLNQHRIYAPKEYIWRVRGEHEAYVRFKAREVLLDVNDIDMFMREEGSKSTIPYKSGNTWYRYFDRKTRFYAGQLVADTPQKEFVKVKIQSQTNDDGDPTDYMGISPFLQAKSYVTFF